MAHDGWMRWCILSVAVIGIMGCSSNSDDAQKDRAVVRKKIAVAAPQPSGSTPAPVAVPVAPSPPPAVDAKVLSEPVPQPTNAQGAAPTPFPKEADIPGDHAITPTEGDGVPKGPAIPTATSPEQLAFKIDNKLDPFIPLFKEETQPAAPPNPEEGKAAPRVPQSPLETMELDQLRLTGVVRTRHLKKALVEEASGKGYVIEVGTYIGLNGGRVTDIFDDRVVVQEEATNVLGKKTVRERELRLLRGEGEASHE